MEINPNEKNTADALEFTTGLVNEGIIRVKKASYNPSQNIINVDILADRIFTARESDLIGEGMHVRLQTLLPSWSSLSSFLSKKTLKQIQRNHTVVFTFIQRKIINMDTHGKRFFHVRLVNDLCRISIKIRAIAV